MGRGDEDTLVTTSAFSGAIIAGTGGVLGHGDGRFFATVRLTSTDRPTSSFSSKFSRLSCPTSCRVAS